jgi:lipoprotein NlpD
MKAADENENMKTKLTFLLLFLTFIKNQAYSEPVIHKIERGETLYSLARQYKVSVGDIMSVNNISSAESVRVGTALTIPSAVAGTGNGALAATNDLPAHYSVKKGDTYYSLARQFGLSVDKLLSLIGRSSSEPLKAGETLTFSSSVIHTNDEDLFASGSITEAPAVKEVLTPPALPSLATPSASAEKPLKPAKPQTETTVRTRPTTGTLMTAEGLTWPAKGTISPNNGVQGGVKISVTGETPIASVISGTVMYKGYYRELGHVVLVLHDSGCFYVYGGFDNVFVKAGDAVKPATVLGTTSRSKDVFFSVYKDGDFIDPKLAPRA